MFTEYHNIIHRFIILVGFGVYGSTTVSLYNKLSHGIVIASNYQPTLVTTLCLCNYLVPFVGGLNEFRCTNSSGHTYIYKLLSHYNPPTKTVLTVANIVHCIPFASINKTLNGTKSSSTSRHFY